MSGSLRKETYLLPLPILEGVWWSIPMGRTTHGLHSVVSSYLHVLFNVIFPMYKIWMIYCDMIGPRNPSIFILIRKMD